MKKICTVYLNIFPPQSIWKTRGYDTEAEAREEAAMRSRHPQHAAVKVAVPYHFEYEDNL